jgi:hypothetical protein
MKKVTKVLALGAAVAALATPVHAATIDFNIYGASAQYLYWNAAAVNFLTASLANSGRACTATSKLETADKKDAIVTGTGCDGAQNNTINFRYSSKASYDGIMAANKVDPAAACGVGNENQRLMITGGTGTSALTLSCQPVHVGASDVSGPAFNQSSTGALLGPMGGAATSRTFNGITPPAGVVPGMPVVVPFGFFANSAIQVTKCSGGSFDGNLCTAATQVADCGAGVTCTGRTLDNVTREMAVNIFAGNAIAWTDFGASYSVTGDTTNNTVVACLRHAGSGTHATLDKVFFTGAEPNKLSSNEATGTTYFNDGSGDEINCINGDTPATTVFTCNAVQGGTPCTVATQLVDCAGAVPANICKSYNNGKAWGAIGYADADQAVGVAGVSNNVVRVKYNGLYPTRAAIRNGAYDWYANQVLYKSPTTAGTGTPQATLYTNLLTYASNPANVPAAKAAYWATAAEMNWNKGSDLQYPGFVGATNAQTP